MNRWRYKKPVVAMHLPLVDRKKDSMMGDYVEATRPENLAKTLELSLEVAPCAACALDIREGIVTFDVIFQQHSRCQCCDLDFHTRLNLGAAIQARRKTSA